MKDQLLLIDEKRETLRINITRARKKKLAFCEICGSRFDWLTIDEAAALFGGDKDSIQERLNILRRNHDKQKCRVGDI